MSIRFTDKESRRAVLCVFDEEGHVRPWVELERQILDHALLVTGGRVTEASARLKVARSTLYRRLDERKLR